MQDRTYRCRRVWQSTVTLTVITIAAIMCFLHHPVRAQGGVLDTVRSLFGSPPPPPPRLVLVFVDISGSIKQDDWDIYQITYFSLVGPADGRLGDRTALRPGPQGGPGDKLILGTISEATLT